MNGVAEGSSAHSSPHRSAHRVLWVLAFMLAAAWPLAVGIIRPGITGYPPAMLPDMIHGRAHQPFVKRHLVPIVVRAGLAITPRAVQDHWREMFRRSALTRRLGWPAQDAPEFVLTVLVMYLSLLGFLIILPRLMQLLLVIPSNASRVVVLALALVLPITYAGKLYLYDFTQLLLFTAGLLCIVRARWVWYYPIFVLACLNKETSVLLIACFAVRQGREILSRANLLHLLAQLTLALSVCAALAWMFHANTGAPVEWHLQRNLAGPGRLGQMRLVVLAACILVAIWSIRAAPLFVSGGFVLTLLPLLIATLFLGYIDELRDYYEALPLGFCLGLLTLGRPWGIRAQAPTAQRGELNMVQP